MNKLQLIRITPDGTETVLEETPVPASFAGDICYPSGYIEKLEKHYQRTGKPKKSYIDAIYICRPQVERWSMELLERYAPSLEAAKWELEKRRAIKQTR